MSGIQFRPATREGVQLLIGVAGPSSSGKTMSALRLAKGMSGGRPFALIDTESGRALHYADDFDFLHGELSPPFSPSRYGEAIKAAAAINPPVIVVDSFSHEHAGEGGVLDMHEAELQRMAGGDYKKREAMKFAAWIKPKKEHKALIQQLLQLRTHLIVCLRAEEKVDLVKDDKGKLQVVPKRTLAGHVGWIPVCGKELPFELTLSLVVTPDAPGFAKPIKLQKQHAPLVPLDRPLDETVGEALAAWAAGGGAKSQPHSEGPTRGDGHAEPPAGIPADGEEGPDETQGAGGSGGGATAQEPDPNAARVVSEAQRRRLHAIRNDRGVTVERCKEILLETTGQDSTAAIPVDLYQAVIARLEAEPRADGGSFAARAEEAQRRRQETTT